MTFFVSAYPAAVDKLIAILTAAFPTGVRIYQGPGASDTKAHKFIHVGLESLEEAVFPGNAGSAAMQWGPMGNHARDEHLAVNCVARVWGGGNNPGQRRDDTFTLFGGIIAAIQADPSIGRPGNVLYVETYTWTYSQQFDGDGTSGLINFTLNFRARI